MPLNKETKPTMEMHGKWFIIEIHKKWISIEVHCKGLGCHKNCLKAILQINHLIKMF